ncbi:glycosyltransferase [Alphaproteobacteria bacterium]|nr:glycosyltransferase [Alphaproteobacteria bacterium]
MIFSIIIPIYNESENIRDLILEIENNLTYNNYEIIVVNDCSTDNSIEVLNKINSNKIKIINLRKRLGQSHAILSGIKNSKSSTIITIDGDGQNDPKDIQNLFDIYNNSNYFLVGGLRIGRKDNFIKKISSNIANKFRMLVLSDDCKDTGCGLKIFDKKIFLSFEFFNGIHRFLPALYKGYGFNTFFTSVNHRPRIKGMSKYGTFKRLIYGLRDIMHVKKIIKGYKSKN